MLYSYKQTIFVYLTKHLIEAILTKHFLGNPEPTDLHGFIKQHEWLCYTASLHPGFKNSHEIQMHILGNKNLQEIHTMCKYKSYEMK